MKKLLAVFLLTTTLAACSSSDSDQASTSGSGSGSGYGSGSGSGRTDRASLQDDLARAAGGPNGRGDRVLFGYDSYSLSPEARQTLDKQAAWLKQNGQVRLQVEGHADERGTREYNLGLGERRANSIRDYLAAVGIAASRLTTISYGKERPEVAGSNDASWSQNRRGVSVVQ